MKRPSLPTLYQTGLKFPKVVLGLSLVLTLLSLFAARNLRIESDLTALLPSHNEDVQNFLTMREHFGGMGHLVVTVEAEDTALAERFAEAFAPRIESLPAILYVDYKAPVDFFAERKWLYLDKEDLEEIDRRVGKTLELQKKGISPILSRWIDLADPEDLPDLEFKDLLKKYEKRYLGAQGAAAQEKGRLLVLWIKAKENPQNLDASRELVAAVRGIERELRRDPRYQTLKVGYTGDYETSIEQADFTRQEIARVSLGVSIVLLLVVSLFFRRVAAIFLVGIPLALGIVWTGGLISILLKHVNVLTGFSAAILAGLGSDYGIYLLARYRREMEKGIGFERACRLAFSNTGKATFGSMITTVAAFAALTLSDFRLFVEFGIVGGIGLLLNYVAMMVVMPALLSLTSGLRLEARGKRQGAFPERLKNKIFNTRGAFGGVILTLLLCLLSSFTIPAQSTVTYQDTQMQPPDLPGARLNERVISQEGVYSSPTLLVHHGADQEEKTVRRLEALLKDRPEGSLVFNRVLGLTSFVPESQPEKKEILRRIAGKFENVRLFLERKKAEFLEGLSDSIRSPTITQEGLPKEIRHRFESVHEKGYYAVYLYSAIYRETAEEMRRYKEGVKRLIGQEGLHSIPVDSNFITHDVVSLIQHEAPQGLLTLIAFLALFVMATIRPLARGAVLIAHLIAGLFLLAGALWCAGIPLNVINVVVFPIILGTGIDCFIHFSHRYDEAGDLDRTLALQTPSILVSNLTTMIGFGGLIFTSSAGLRSIGWLAVIGIGLMTILCLFVFPRALSLRQGSSLVQRRTP